MKAWQQRYFVLEGQTLTYWKSDKEAGNVGGARGTINLAGSTAGLRPDSTIRFDIDDAGGRSWHLRARSPEDAAEWLVAIHDGGARPSGQQDQRAATGESCSNVFASGSSVVEPHSSVHAAAAKLQAHTRRKSAAKPKNNQVSDSGADAPTRQDTPVPTRVGYLQKLRDGKVVALHDPHPPSS